MNQKLSQIISLCNQLDIQCNFEQQSKCFYTPATETQPYRIESKICNVLTIIEPIESINPTK